MPWTITTPLMIWAIGMAIITLWLWFFPPYDKLAKLIVFVDYILINLFSYFCMNWALVNYYMRYLTVILSFALALRLINKSRRTPFKETQGKPFWPRKTILDISYLTTSVVLLLGLMYLDFRVLRSLAYPAETAMLSFPLHKGLYVAMNGGNGMDGIGMNNHYHPWPGAEEGSNRTMAYALDTMAMDTTGVISAVRKPKTALQYEIFNDIVYSPCWGEVVYVEDGHPDVPLFSPAPPLGNYIVIRCVDYYITLGNLKKDTIIFGVGQSVNLGDMVAHVGNSGTPSIPHLHIHATKGGWKEGEAEPIPMLFESAFELDEFFVRNDVLVR